MGDLELVADNVDELINLFDKHLFRSSSSQASNAFNLLVDRVYKFYENKIDLGITIREKILTFLLNLRVNYLGQIAYITKSEESCGIACVGNDTYLPTIPFSPYVLCAPCICNINDKSTLHSPPTSPSIHGELSYHTVDLHEMFKVILKCLQRENDWSIMKMVLYRLRLFIVNNPEIFKFICFIKDLNDGGSTETSNAYAGAYESSPKHRSSANNVVNIACSLITDRPSFTGCINLDPKSVKTEFEILIYQVLEVLIVHGKILDPLQRRKLVETIANGLYNSRYTKQTISSLTFCMMEMQDSKMGETFKRILLELSKTSSKLFALPKLNFLSNLILFPNLYSNFNDREYLYIFAIATPLANYPEFDAFTVALAHRVVGMWFLTCKLSYRKDVVKFIYSHLEHGAGESYRNRSQSSGASIGNGRSPDPVLSRPPHTPSHLPRHPNSPSSFSTHSSSSNTNFFFSDSQSISSLRHGTQASQAASISNSAISNSSSALSSSMSSVDHQVQKELFETCMDLLGRYTYGSCSSTPSNHPYADLLVDRTKAKTWLFGSSTVTISTSGCTSRIVSDGLCQRCLHHFKRISGADENVSSLSSSSSSASIIGHHSERRRHQSDYGRGTRVGSLHASVLSSCNTKSLRSMDDSHLSSFEYASQCNLDYARAGTCSCLCQGWAEIVVRKPTGKITSMMRLVNSLSLPMSNIGVPSDFSNLYDPHFLNFTRTIVEQVKSDDTFDDNVILRDNGSNANETVVTTSASTVEQNTSIGQRTSTDVTNTTASTECKDLPASDSQIDIGVEPLCLPLSGRNSSEDGNTDIITCSMDTNIACFHSNDSTSGTSGMATESSSSSSVFSSSSTSSVNSTIGTVGSNSISNNGTWSSNMSKQKIARAQSLGQSDRSRVSPDKVHRPELTIPNSINSADFNDNSNQTATAPPVLTSTSNVFTSLTPRQRSHTVSGQQGQRHTLSGHYTGASSCLGSNNFLSSASSGYNEPKVHGISPSFVFLKLYSNFAAIHDHDKKPLLLVGDNLNRAIRHIDLIFPFETHKIAIVYVGHGQEDSKLAILGNDHGSYRYQEMLSRIGVLQRLSEIDETTCFIGGLDKSGKDGKFVYCWHDHLTQVVFHVATLMPTDTVKDKMLIGKLKHIGNDSVVIVYNDSGRPFDRATLASEFLRFYIIVTPLGGNLNHVQIQTDPEISKIIGHAESSRLSDDNLPLYIRQIAIQANLLFTQQFQSRLGGALPFISNWVERLRKLKSLRDKAQEELNSAKEKAPLSSRTQSETHNRPILPPLNIHDYPDDFTKYTA